jgi:hypothetical protein
MISRPLRVLAILAVSALAAVNAEAADDSTCPTIADPAARLACYDAVKPPHPASAAAPVARPAVAAPDPRPAIAANPPAASAPAAVKPSKPSRLALMLSPKSHADDGTAAPERVRATVTQVQMRPVGQIITLDNGQVWQIPEYRRDPFVRAQDVVDVKAGSLGSFLMAPASGGAGVYVKRVN